LYYTSANGQFSVSKRLKNGYKWFTSFLIHFASSFYSSAMSLSTALLDQAFEHAQLGSEGDCDPPSIERIDSLLNISSCPHALLLLCHHLISIILIVALQDEFEDEVVAATLLDSKLFNGSSKCWRNHEPRI
jgi:hypothetical protein